MKYVYIVYIETDDGNRTAIKAFHSSKRAHEHVRNCKEKQTFEVLGIDCMSVQRLRVDI
jgi:hypothetical protein